MRRRLTRPTVVAAAAFVLVVPPLGAQDTDIKSVRFRVEPKTTGALSISIENTRDSALDAWEIGLTPGGATDGENFIGSFAPAGANYGPLAPRATRTVPFRGPSTTPPNEVHVLAAVFADGRCEGSPAALGKLTAQLKERAAELAYWQDVFNKIPVVSDKEQVDYLMSKIAERAGQTTTDPLSIRANLRSALSGQRPDAWVSTTVARYGREIGDALRKASRPLVPAAADAPSSVIARPISTERTWYTAYIENLRDVPIEAWTIEFAPGRSAMTHDACESDPAAPPSPGNASGRIRPREVREEKLYPPVSSDAPLQISLTMVFFDDLSFEGSVRARDELLKDRERRAGEDDYWIRAFKEASSLPVDQMRAFLQAKRGERASHLAVTPLPGSPWLQEALARLDRSPETFPNWLVTRVTTLEQERARLLRHRNR